VALFFEYIKPFWSNENKDSKYTLRIKFDVVKVTNDWQKEKKFLSRTGIDYFYGINYVEPVYKKLSAKLLSWIKFVFDKSCFFE